MNKMLIGSLLMGTLSVGTIAMTFNGGSTIENTKNYLKDATNKLSVFKANETKLVDAINNMKTSKAELLNQIKQLESSNSSKQTEIENLNSQVTTLNNKIKELEELLASGGSSNEELQNENDRLTQELNKANTEITKANDMVASLQTELNTQKAKSDNIKPLSDDEINKLINDNTITQQPTNPTTPTTPPTTPTTPTTPTYDYTITTSSDSYYFTDITISIMGDMWIFEGTAQYPVIVYFSDGTSQNCQPNGIETFSKKVVKVQYKTSTGTTKLIQVNR